MLREIRLAHFKCFDFLGLPCAPLNLLCGVNGMGKSSVIQALLVLRQSFLSGDLQEGRLILGGDLVDLGAGSDVLFEDAGAEIIAFRLDADKPAGTWLQAFGYSPTGDQLARVATGRDRDDLVWLYDGLKDGESSAEAGAGAEATSAWASVPPFGGRLVYVQAERVGPRKFYPLSEVRARRGDLGARGEYAWNYLNDHPDELLAADDPRCDGTSRRRLIDVVDHWLQDVCPGAHLQLESVAAADAVVAGFSFDRPGDVASRRHRATNVGFGLSYALPVVLALLAAPGTLCLIENPEAHLHPRGQTRLAELAVRAVGAGVQVFAETHSDHFLDGVRLAVRGGLIAPQRVGVHYFERSEGRTVVSSPTLDADGRLSHWPAGFFDQHEENLARLLAPRN